LVCREAGGPPPEEGPALCQAGAKLVDPDGKQRRRRSIGQDRQAVRQDLADYREPLCKVPWQVDCRVRRTRNERVTAQREHEEQKTGDSDCPPGQPAPAGDRSHSQGHDQRPA
jgi:hypothetical protein